MSVYNKVRVVPGYFEMFTARTEDGRRVTWEWGEPDADNFYSPIATARDDGMVLITRKRLNFLEACAEVLSDLPVGISDLIGSDD